jgi:uncharacterized membrane protein YfcA
MSLTILFLILLFAVAFLYAAVGHGGASGYLALMALFSMTPEFMKPTALLLNLFVSLSAFILFFKGGHFKWKIFLPFALASIPFSFFGGMISLDAAIYKKILGILLLFPVIRLVAFPNKTIDELKTPDVFISLLIGAIIGFLSGLIGIGGGIILSPVLLLLAWTNQETDGCYQRSFHFRKFTIGFSGTDYKRDRFSVGHDGLCGDGFCGWVPGCMVRRKAI